VTSLRQLVNAGPEGVMSCNAASGGSGGGLCPPGASPAALMEKASPEKVEAP
jgi:hypothetical protein